MVPGAHGAPLSEVTMEDEETGPRIIAAQALDGLFAALFARGYEVIAASAP